MCSGSSRRRRRGFTFVENALIKARAACAATGLPALADDSGVVVDALEGAPGVRSARYAGGGASDADNVAKLLEALEGVTPPERGAAFVCAIVYLRHVARPVPDRLRRGSGRDGSSTRREAPEASATTPCSSLRHSAGPRPNSRVRRRTRSVTAGRRSRSCSTGSPSEDRGRSLHHRHQMSTHPSHGRLIHLGTGPSCTRSATRVSLDGMWRPCTFGAGPCALALRSCPEFSRSWQSEARRCGSCQSTCKSPSRPAAAVPGALRPRTRCRA